MRVAGSRPRLRPGEAVDGLACLLHRRSKGWRHRAVGRGIAWLSWGAFLSMIAWRTHVGPGSRLGGVVRWWRWQLARRRGLSALVELPAGGRLLVPTWSQLGILVASGFTEPRDQLFVTAILRSGDHFVDVGANIGLYTVAAGSTGASVDAFEPSGRAAAALTVNATLNGCRPTVHQLALEDFTGTAMLSDGDATASLGSSGTPVAVDRLDDRCLSSDGELVVLKIDAEGHDAGVLRGAEKTLDRVRPVVLVEVWDGGGEIRGLLARHGYRFYDYDWRSQTMLPLADDWHGHGNLIAIPAERVGLVEARLGRPPVLRRVRVSFTRTTPAVPAV